ncbi:hypothetical protein C8J56DRAFT_214803 [Mycena floridula]|nr:hypothetical protein C8J56DRAFT_214803 [Mycena floridula]
MQTARWYFTIGIPPRIRARGRRALRLPHLLSNCTSLKAQSHPHRSSTPRLPASAVSQNPAYMTNQHHRSSSIPYTGSNTSQFAGMTQQTGFQTYNQAYGGNEAAITPQSYNNYQQAGQQGNFWDPYQMQTMQQQQQQQQQFGASYPSTAQPVYQHQYPAQYNTGMCYCQGPQCFCGNRQQY